MKRKLAIIITIVLATLLLLTACNGAKFGMHKVTFDANGGDVSFWDKSTNVQTYGTVELPIPTREGYVFLGWYIGEGVNEAQFTATSMVTSDITLKAKWAQAEYTVTFIDYYGNPLARETVKHGEAANAPLVPRIADKCLRFDAWDTDISAITTDTEVKALYVVDSHSVTYVTGTSQTIPTTTYFFGETPVLPPEPALPGHYFIGWYLDEAFTTEYLFDSPLTEDITLYAYFNESIPVSTLEEILAIPEYSSSNYFLKNDIDCEGAVINTSIIGFTGTLDGCGHTVYNFVYQPAQAENVGLFATNGGTIKNLNFKDFSYTLTHTNINSNVGFLVGNNSGTIENVHLNNASTSFSQNCSGSASYSSCFGAITGRNNGKVTNCSVIESNMYLGVFAESWWHQYPTSTSYAGAVVGINGGTVENSVSQTKITGYATNANREYSNSQYAILSIGGLVSVNDSIIRNCESAMEATLTAGGDGERRAYVGGFVSFNNAEIENSFATASITSDTNYHGFAAAGFAQENRGTIKNCYTNVNIENASTNSIFGGFVAHNNAGIDHCYAYGTMNVGAATAGKGGFAGYNDGSINSCFTDVAITATDATNYAPFVGCYGSATYITNCYYSIKATFTVNGQPHITENPNAAVADPVLQFANTTFLSETLGWSADIWNFDANQLNYPTLK